MPTLIQQLQAVLDPLLAGGMSYAINTAELNAETVYPYGTFLFVSSIANNTLTGPTDIQNTRVQVDLYATDPATLDAAGKAVLAAMAAAPFQNVQLTSQDGYEDQVRVYRRSIDFSVWSTN